MELLFEMIKVLLRVVALNPVLVYLALFVESYAVYKGLLFAIGTYGLLSDYHRG